MSLDNTAARPVDGTSQSSPLWAFLSVSAERRAVVIDDITQGSIPRPMYYILMGLSVLLASFGLLANSPAVVIGAMLVSPLMTPIFGVAFSLSRGDFSLLRNALIAEFGGVFLAVLLAFLLGMLPLFLEATPEMLSRTSPTLLDLLVATFAGLAGCLTMIDERISPVLPGVAIATALTPPLATSGLCLAFGAYNGAWGAFLLFFANFLAILAVSTAIFIASGFVTRSEIGSVVDFARRFAAAGIGLLVVVVLLTYYLLGIVEYRRTKETITNVLEAQLALEPNTTLEQILFSRNNDRLNVLSVVRTPRVLQPQVVKRIEDALTAALDEDVDLFFRCSLTKEVVAIGSRNVLPLQTLDGITEIPLSPEAQTLQLAEQVARERLSELPNLILNDVELVNLAAGPLIIVSIQSPQPVVPLQVQGAEQLLRERTGNPHLRLLIRSVTVSDTTSKGTLLYGQAHFGALPEDQRHLQQAIEQTTRDEIHKLPNLIAGSIDAAVENDSWAVRAEVIGPRVPSPEEVASIETALHKAVKLSVTVSLLSRTDVVVTRQNYASIESYIEAEVRKRQQRTAAQTGQSSN